MPAQRTLPGLDLGLRWKRRAVIDTTAAGRRRTWLDTTRRYAIEEHAPTPPRDRRGRRRKPRYLAVRVLHFTATERRTQILSDHRTQAAAAAACQHHAAKETANHA